MVAAHTCQCRDCLGLAVQGYRSPHFHWVKPVQPEDPTGAQHFNLKLGHGDNPGGPSLGWDETYFLPRPPRWVRGSPPATALPPHCALATMS